ncbi:aminopeptidase N [Barrientosiimonas humi]|uniref:Aminopeptidase N n=1 Tax=Barrientosiimonas humi TaxID=999931 RepID=A0A542X9V8_9MICO|nr:aminopeptidase N [Barrientosiimonas humi]TQL32617.1 aminopeptidase N [Barrientosiimonas humi]CAG7572608.1 Aminopeptidase N [Barrientosiimonas humi]
MPGQNLTRDEAQARSQLIEVESYSVSLDLTTGPETFRTRSEVRFTATEPGAETFIDFIGDSVEEIVLNGTSLDPAEHFADSRVRLPGLAAENTLVVTGTGRYMNTGEGLHRMVDPTDQEVYLYTQFEVADCRRMFPVFEQPDLKATFAFTVTAPAAWTMLSNQPTPEPTPAEGSWTNERGESAPVATWAFEPTPRISCYITALVAGPYDVVRDEVSTRAGVVPLGLFCRRSLREFLDPENIFEVTKQGFAFFEEHFDAPYPFAKYDQIFTPEYNAGAMENAGCVTFSEVYVFRAKVPEAVVERRAGTILHELAHMWFGNLVTMRWWDDLWLNESFAEWAAITSQAEATRWETGWTTFAMGEKAWAYNQDQLSSTHPIAADMVDLESVEENFDGITYAKGASVLKQLVAYVGREPFEAGLRAYFAKHAWGNTRLADLLTELEATSGRDLSTWSQLWLETAGVNTLRPLIETDADGVITSFAVEQTAPADYPTLRPHRLAIGLYDLDGGRLVRRERVEADVDGERTEVPALVGMRRGDLVLVNDDDLAYAKVRLDGESLATALANPRGFVDPLPRAILVGAAWDMTRDAELPARDFVDLALATLPGETDSNLVRTLLQHATLAASRFVAPQHRDTTRGRFAAGLLDLARSAEPGSDAQLQLVQAFAGQAGSDEHAAVVRGWLSGEDPLPGLAVDTEMRWTLLTSLAAAGVAQAADIDAELQRDRTSTGAERAARALAARPTAEAKDEAWQRALDPTTPNQTRRATAHGFQVAHDRSLLQPYVARYHEALTPVWRELTSSTAGDVTVLMYPGSLADQQLADASQTWLDSDPAVPAGARRLVAENRDGVLRAVQAQACDAQRDA